MPNLFAGKERKSMNPTDICELKTEILKGQEVLATIQSYFDANSAPGVFQKKDIKDAVFLAEIYVNYYTAAETIFLRISQFLENHLSKDSWHRSLLNKMRLEIPGVRKAVIRDETYDVADELLRFRHFKRYYFEFRYDWDRIEFLGTEFKKLTQLLQQDLKDYINFLDELAQEAT